MSNTWPPQRKPPPQNRWPKSRSASQPPPPSSDEADSGYGRYGAPGPSSTGRYGAPGPSSTGRLGGRSPQRGEPWPQWGGAPAPEKYPPRPPSPYYPQYPEAPRGTPYPYSLQDPHGSRDPYAPRDPYGSQPPPRRRSGFSLVEVVLLLVIAIIIAAGGIWALTRYGPFAKTTTQPTTAQGTSTSQAQGTPPAGEFHLYTSTSLGVQFDMPDGWTNQDARSSFGPGVQATSPDGNAAIGVEVILGKTGNNVAAANAGMAGLADPGTLDINEGPSQMTFGGATWVREAGDLSRSGVRLHMVIFVATHGLNTYALFFIATISTFAADNARYFQATTESFRFLS